MRHKNETIVHAISAVRELEGHYLLGSAAASVLADTVEDLRRDMEFIAEKIEARDYGVALSRAIASSPEVEEVDHAHDWVGAKGGDEAWCSVLGCRETRPA